MQSHSIDRLSIVKRPRGLPLMRQWWGKLLFMHWPVAPSLLRPLVPPMLSIDTFEGQAWVGVVPFTMWGVRPYVTPPCPGFSSFHELNVRTYVHFDGVPGVLFLSMDINSPLAAWGARHFFLLPYYPARMSLGQRGRAIDYASDRDARPSGPAAFRASWTFDEPLPQSEPDSLTFFLTERYCLYTAEREQLYRLRIAHAPWPLRHAALDSHDSNVLEALGLPAPPGQPLLHYADAIKVDIFPLTRVLKTTPNPLLEPANASETLT
ncbi:MAG TPA: DUF2071 domain-containing protein [Pyrinomonadaceae bacterium]|nr:DUF2071 domain-containing protein [Pyrinomonadaceae bacterium]